MNVAIIHPSLACRGGAENVVVSLGAGLAARGHRVRIFTAAWRPELWDSLGPALPRVHVLTTPWLARMVRSKTLTRSCHHAELAAALGDADVVNAHNYPSYHWALGARDRARGSYPILWYCHEPRRRLYHAETDANLMGVETLPARLRAANPHLVAAARELRAKNHHFIKGRKRARDRRWDRALVRRIDHVLANSEFTRRHVAAVFGVDATVCHPGIGYPSEAPPGAAPRERRARDTPDGAAFLTVGSCAAKKNLANVLEAVRILAARRNTPRIRLEVTGSPAAAEAVRSFAARHGIEDRVEPLGWLSDPALRRRYAAVAATVYVPIDEPFGLMPVESMLEGTPAIVSDHGGPAEVVAHGRTGLHVNPFDPQAIAAAMATLAGDEAQRRALGEAGREAAQARFTLGRFLDRFEVQAAIARERRQPA